MAKKIVKLDDLTAVFRHMRERRTWTQKELADKAGVTMNKIKWYENNEKSMPTIDTVVKVAKAFGYEVKFVKVR